MNPLKLMQSKKLLEDAMSRFQNNHPKFPLFLSAVSQKGLREGTVLEFKVTTPEGEELVSNLKLSADDLALLQELKDIAGK